MAQIAFSPSPGIFRIGTEKESSGKWYAGNLIRWTNGQLRPIYGWQAHSPSAYTGACRSLLAWKDNAASSWIGIGTHSKLYIMSKAGTLYDVTPAAYTVGRADSTAAAGYGNGVYGGNSNYGAPIPDTTSILDATTWSLDTWGQNLVGVTPDDTNIYQWVAPTTGTIAAKVTNSPTCAALVVTPERFLFALGSTDPRTVSWCDQGNNTVWTPTVTNQAGSFPLLTFGRIMCGRPLAGGTAIWTDADMWIANYIGGTLIYGFQRVGNGCGVVSRQAVAVANSQAVWMGAASFWLWNGYPQPLPCDVQDYVFGNINRAQISKVYAVRNSQFNEVWWFYPSAGSIENDSVVVWDYAENTWATHNIARTAACDVTGAFQVPLMANPTDNLVYEHETGFGYSGAAPYAETGPLQFAPLAASYQALTPGVFVATKFVPDDTLIGDVTATFKAKFYPDGPETVIGPLTLTPKVDVRFSARQVKMRIAGVRADDWRFGIGTLEVNGRQER